ncbi:MAG: DUF908 domain-containing protein [Methanomicrobiales archaeon]|nr:DUF908 domain-containing protein [Methanomicrobiales archaeon]
MADKKSQGGAWRTTTVRVRPDIYQAALEQKIDISDACNQALADLLGIDYRQQQLATAPLTPPVIIAGNGGLPVPEMAGRISQDRPRPPVINADDPNAAGAIATTRRKTVPRQSPPPPEVSATGTGAIKTPHHPSPSSPAPKAKKTLPKKPEKKDVVKRFVAATVVRDDADNAVIPKEDLYQLFSRWCRSQKIQPVPDAKSLTVALKTKFAFTEKSSGGRPCWAGVRLK